MDEATKLRPKIGTPRTMGDGTVEIRLKHSVEAFGDTVDTLTMRRPNLGDLMKTDGMGPMKMIGKMIELCCGVPARTVKSIDAEDLAAISEVVAGFLDSSPEAGDS